MGIRPGEKIHEEMITETDSLNTIDCGKYYVILPSISDKLQRKILNHHSAKELNIFSYNSGTNKDWETVESLRIKIRDNVYPDFEV